MKTQSENPSAPWRLALQRSRHLIGGLLLSTLAANAEVQYTFDSNTQGFSAGGDANSLTWVNDPDFGGCLKVVLVNNTEGYRPNSAFIDIFDPVNQALRDEFAAAANLGGTMKFTAHVRTADFMGTTPGYLPGYYGIGYLLNAETGYNIEFPTYIGGYVPGGTVTVTIEVPIVAAGSGGGVSDNNTLEYFALSTYNQLSLGVNTSKGGDGFLGHTIYIDDFTVTANTIETPPPNVTITPAVPGLNMIASAGGQYDRQGIRTVDGLNLSWVGKATVSTPVTYEWTIKQLPPGFGFESFMYLIPGTGLGLDSAADYSQPNGIQLAIYPNGDGTGSMSFRYKVDSPGSNGPSGREYYATDLGDGLGGQITAVNSANMLGIWKCTFTSNTDFTLTAPDGTTSTGALHPSTVDNFTGPMYVHFGCIPSQVANVGLAAIFSRAKITGTPDNFDENFSSGSLPSSLEICASVPASVLLITPDLSKYWLNYTLPAPGYVLKQSVTLGANNSWEDFPGPVVTYATKFGRAKLLLQDELLSTSKNFFRLEKPATP